MKNETNTMPKSKRYGKYLFFLWLLLQHGFNTVVGQGANCCTMMESELTNLIGIADNCPAARRTTLSDKCQECPAGQCKVPDDYGGAWCYCPQVFLDSVGTTGTLGFAASCERSFGIPWPDSIGRESTFERSCTDDATSLPAAPQDTNCCSMEESVLLSFVGTSDDCPATTSPVQLSNKCQRCPYGTCKLNNGSTVSCYCPRAFLDSVGKTGILGYASQCESAYGIPWPDSVGKENRYERSCDTTTSDPTPQDPSPSSPSTSPANPPNSSPDPVPSGTPPSNPVPNPSDVIEDDDDNDKLLAWMVGVFVPLGVAIIVGLCKLAHVMLKHNLSKKESKKNHASRDGTERDVFETM